MTLPPTPRLFADANTLYSSALRDLLIELDLANVIQLRWSDAVLVELSRALVRTRPEYSSAKADGLIDAMTQTLPKATVAADEAEPLAVALPDAADHHVLASARASGCNVLLTFNLRHFPKEIVDAAAPGLQVWHPDALLINVLTSNAAATLPVFALVQSRLTRPAMTLADYTASLSRSGLPQTSELIRYLLAG